MDSIILRAFAAVSLLSLLCTIPATPALARQQQGSWQIQLASSNLGMWLPEGDEYGNAMLPSATAKDLILRIRWTRTQPPYYPNEYYGFAVVLYSSCLPGQYTNDPTGEQPPPPPPMTLPLDCTFEENRNPTWWIPSSNVDLPYIGTQVANLEGTLASDFTALTYSTYSMNQEAELRISSYDWGGRGEIHVMLTTIGNFPEPPPPPLILGFPLDDNNNDVPDSVESEFVLPTMDEDKDRDDRQMPLHGQDGDGITAGQEYRTIKVKGRPKRVWMMGNDGPTLSIGGPKVKDAFIYSESDPILGSLFTAGLEGNNFLRDFAILWHLIDKTDMVRVYDAPTNPSMNSRAGELQADPTVFGDPPITQHGVWLMTVNNLMDDGTKLYGLTPGLGGVNDGKPVLIDPGYIKSQADGLLGCSAATLMKFIVAHELGHKLSLLHVLTTRTNVQTMPETPSFSTCWQDSDNAKKLYYWVPVYVNDDNPLDCKQSSLEYAYPGGDNPPVTDYGVNQGATFSGPTISIHGKNHRYANAATLYTNVVPSMGTILIVAHKGLLMDAKPNPDDFADIEAYQLEGPQIAAPKLW